ncbi:MerR family transcriptional regulator [Propylenella binzhouense]|uniref:MerR family transcriptional regulator n=1 Tax=Propylenella binzhouense TaxID=2555902 RepID=A0A964WTY7_9HYPH|nr:MerR family transcriptional regulator [Propylenella binzhouense]MYZ48483.1 MerR family transcriptional regulator [Propylenella binzhouense]
MKSPEAFRTISEVAEDLALPQHVLRFWETRFAQIKPLKRGGGRRYYRPDDVGLLRGIKVLLYGEGFTIKGVQRLLKEKGVAFVIAVGQGGSVEAASTPEPSVPAADAGPEREAAVEAWGEEDEPVEPVGAEAWQVEPERSEEADHRPRARSPASGEAERRLLESALTELLEAKRMLDQAR